MAESRIALITGGGTGIGRAIALALGREGIAVAVNYSRSQAEAEATVSDLEQMGAPALAVRADVTDDAQVRAMVSEVVTRLGGLDCLVNSAGWTQFVAAKDLEALTDEIWDRAFDVNLKGAFRCVRAAVPEMQERGGGSILNIASVAGISGQGSSMAYCASKAALICLTRSLAKALAPAIRVNCVAPGVIDTRWVAGKGAFMRAAREKTPLRRNGTPEDVAAVAVPLLLSAEFVTGQTIPIDGGITA